MTVADLVFELHLPKARVLRTLKGMESRGFLTLEPSGEKTFVRLIRLDYQFVGRQVTQRRRLKTTGRKEGKSDDYEGPMFG